MHMLTKVKTSSGAEPEKKHDKKPSNIDDMLARRRAALNAIPKAKKQD